MKHDIDDIGDFGDIVDFGDSGDIVDFGDIDDIGDFGDFDDNHKSILSRLKVAACWSECE